MDVVGEPFCAMPMLYSREAGWQARGSRTG